MQNQDDMICVDEENEQLVPYEFYEEPFEKRCSSMKRSHSTFNCVFDNKQISCFSPPPKKRFYEINQRFPDVTWNSFEDLFTFLKYRVLSFAVNKCHMITMESIQPEKNKITNKNTELFFGLCSNYKQVNNVTQNKFVTAVGETDCILNSKVIDTTNVTHFSLNKFNEQFSQELDLFGCQIKMGLSSCVSPTSIYSPELDRIEDDMVDKESVFTQEVNSSESFGSHQLNPHFCSQYTNEKSLNNILKLKGCTYSPVKEGKCSSLLILNDFLIPYKHDENIHIVPDENIYLDQNGKPSETSESLYPNENHFDYEKYCLLNDKRGALSPNSLLLSNQENRILPFKSERSVSKKTIDYIISELMSTQVPAIDYELDISVKRKISFDQLENSVVPDIENIESNCFKETSVIPDIEDIQSNCISKESLKNSDIEDVQKSTSFLKGNVAKKAKVTQEEDSLIEHDCFTRPQAFGSSTSVPFSHEIFINNIPNFKTPQKLRLGLSKKKRVFSLHPNHE